MQEQIDATVEDAVQRARSTLPQGQSSKSCQECGEPIPRARQEAVPGVKLCITCQSKRDRQSVFNSGINRRGSKDSQLR